VSRDPVAEKQPLILVVDDDAGIRMVARTLFEQAGMRVTEAQDGLEALRARRSERTRPRVTPPSS
jgi:CheY-like chemotaxis protein